MAEAAMAEPAAVAEHVQHAAIAEIAGRRHAVLALIEIEARLLPFGQIDLVRQAVIDDHQRPVGRLAPVRAVAQLDALRPG